MRRVVITGLGVLSPVGNTVEEFRAALKAGRHGFTLEPWFPGQSEEKNVVARVKNFDDSEYIDKREARRTDMVTRYAVYASKRRLRTRVRTSRTSTHISAVSSSQAASAAYRPLRSRYSTTTTRATGAFPCSLSP